jgi:hypothetical protein
MTGMMPHRFAHRNPTVRAEPEADYRARFDH